MSKGSKIMVDGKKSPEYTRLALAFLGGVVITVLIMSLTAGQVLQGYLSLDTLPSKKALTVQPVKKDVMEKRDSSGVRDTMMKKYVKVKNFRDASFVLSDGRVFTGRDVVSYTLHDRGTVDDVGSNEVIVSGEQTELETISFVEADRSVTDVEDVVTYTLVDGTEIDAGEVVFIEVADSSQDEVGLTYEMKDLGS